MDRNVRLPIKVVVPSDADVVRPDHGGGGSKVFGEVTPGRREELDDEVGRVERYFQASFRSTPGLPAVARVVLKDEALAKSHRPTEVFDSASCPVIGVGSLGELYVSARPDGLRNLSQRLRHLTTKVGVAHISTIQTIAPFTGDDALGPGGRDRLGRRLEASGSSLKLRLFRHHDAGLDESIYRAFMERVRSLQLPLPESVYYAPALRIFRVERARAETIDSLAQFVGTQSLSTFPAYRVHRTAARAVGSIDVGNFPPPVAGVDYPVVGVVDSGIDPTNVCLAPWVVAREQFVPQGDRDHDHGTFVAGLAVHAGRLNQYPRFPDVSSRILDVQAIPASGCMTEDDLVTILEDVLPRYPGVKVWNLSLTRDDPCEDQSFSDLAVALDRLQDQYDVTFVIAAGNYNELPLRGWPPDDVGESDRIAPPADSVRGLSVGSVAHLDKLSSRVRRHQPSPFSRRGPGPVFVPKPEVVHFGGNCDSSGAYVQTGVISTSGPGLLAENIGTSFAAPMVATLLANVESALVAPASRNLSKALLVHSAVLECNAPTPAQDLKYRGFGVPGNLASVLTCTPWSATLVFETSLVPGLEFARSPFPIPDCLRGPDGAVRGEILMTAVYDPPLDPAFGAEYCRTNVDVSLGTYDPGKTGKPEHRKQVPAEPHDVSQLYERNLVEHGFKWAPVKVYRRTMQRVSGRDWRLKVTVQHRSGFSSSNPQSFALLVTLRDPERRLPVYDEVVAMMQRLGWITLDLEVQERVRARS